jgi:hypothetical protein
MVAELADVDKRNVGDLVALEADLAMLLAQEDVEAVDTALERGSIAAVLVYENRWAGPLASSIRRSGGQLVASGRVPTQAPDGGGCRNRRRRRAWSRSARRPSRPARGSSRRPRDLPVDTTRPV